MQRKPCREEQGQVISVGDQGPSAETIMIILVAGSIIVATALALAVVVSTVIDPVLSRLGC